MSTFKKWIKSLSTLKIIQLSIVYLSITIMSITLSAENEYVTIGWKLVMGQLFAMPALIMAMGLSFIVDSMDFNREEVVK